MKTVDELVIRDVIHGDIIVSEPWAIEIIDSLEFQRLRRILQLAGGQLAFPGATHNRFTHCLGVYYVIGQITAKPCFQKYYHHNLRALELVRLAGLLHDIGHGPFSHSFEQINHVVANKIHHEFYSTLIIKSPESQINQILKRYHFTDDEINAVCDMIEGKYDADPILSGLVSSQIDADRIDYLLRDGFYSGADYGRLDIQWLIRQMDIDVANQRVVYSQKAIFAIQSFLIGRYNMYKQVYHHPISLGFDFTLRMWFQRVYDLYHTGYKFTHWAQLSILEDLLNNRPATYQQYINMDDYQFTMLFRVMAQETDAVLKQLSTCLLQRHLFKKTNPEEENEIKTQLVQKYGKINYKYFWIKEKLPVVEFYNDQDKPIYIASKDGSHVVQQLENFFELKIKKPIAKEQISFTIR